MQTLDELEKLAKWHEWGEIGDCDHTAAAATIRAAMGEIERLRGALRPFARAADWWKAFDDQQRITSLHQHGDCLEVAHLRTARAALNQKGPQDAG